MSFEPTVQQRLAIEAPLGPVLVMAGPGAGKTYCLICRVQHLIQERWLEVHPGIGTVVAEPPQARPGDRKRLLHQEVEQLVVEAKRVGLSLQDVVEAIGTQWSRLDRTREAEGE